MSSWVTDRQLLTPRFVPSRSCRPARPCRTSGAPLVVWVVVASLICSSFSSSSRSAGAFGGAFLRSCGAHLAVGVKHRPARERVGEYLFPAEWEQKIPC